MVVRGRSQAPRSTRSRRDRAQPSDDRRPGGGPLRARAQPRRQPHHRRHAALRAGDPPDTRRQRRPRPAGWQRSDRGGDHARARDRAARSSTHQHKRRRGPTARSLGAPTQHAARCTRSLAARGSVLDDRRHRQRRRRHCARGPADLRHRYDRSTAPRPHSRHRYRSHDREPQRCDGQIPRGGTRRGSQPRSGTIAERSRRAAVAPPTNICPHPSTPWIPLVEHDHIIGQRHIRSGRYHATVKPLKLQPVLGLRVVRIRPRISRDAAAHLAQLELGLELLHPIESHPPLTRHRSRHLQLPVGRTRPTPTGR